MTQLQAITLLDSICERRSIQLVERREMYKGWLVRSYEQLDYILCALKFALIPDQWITLVKDQKKEWWQTDVWMTKQNASPPADVSQLFLCVSPGLLHSLPTFTILYLSIILPEIEQLTTAKSHIYSKPFTLQHITDHTHMHDHTNERQTYNTPRTIVS